MKPPLNGTRLGLGISEGFANAHVARKEIEDVARADRKEIKREIIRQNQNYIEALGVPQASKVQSCFGRGRQYLIVRGRF